MPTIVPFESLYQATGSKEAVILVKAGLSLQIAIRPTGRGLQDLNEKVGFLLQDRSPIFVPFEQRVEELRTSSHNDIAESAIARRGGVQDLLKDGWEIVEGRLHGPTFKFLHGQFLEFWDQQLVSCPIDLDVDDGTVMDLFDFGLFDGSLISGRLTITFHWRLGCSLQRSCGVRGNVSTILSVIVVPSVEV